MDFHESTRQYEAWLEEHLPSPLVREDLDVKHAKMAESPFAFLRATFYRWTQTFAGLCPDLAACPKVLAVGDLHLENFGTWRDREGRLVWGINDFDEAFSLPYTSDLVRLATSVSLAIEEGRFDIKKGKACACLLEGYQQGLSGKANPLVLGEELPWLRDLAVLQINRSGWFWKKASQWKRALTPPPEAAKVLSEALPPDTEGVQLLHRQAGMGSLGRPRIVALGRWRGDWVAREAKALLLSACVWAHGSEVSETFADDLLRKGVRSPDPSFEIHPHWIVRRLAPDQIKIEIGDLAADHHEKRLLFAMGQETANLHRGTSEIIPSILNDLKLQEVKDQNWLLNAVRATGALLEEDWKAWKKYRRLAREGEEKKRNGALFPASL